MAYVDKYQKEIYFKNITLEKSHYIFWKRVRLFANWNYNKKILCIFLLLVMLVYAYYSFEFYDFKYTTDPINQPDTRISSQDKVLYDYDENQRYLINNTNCRIPYINPLNKEIRKFIRTYKYTFCTDKGLLTYIRRKNKVPFLGINLSLLSSYSALSISCCYMNITRSNLEKKYDYEVTFSKCVKFEGETKVNHHIIQVTCSTAFRVVYSNVHMVIMPRERRKTERKNKFSVLIVGIDSISKMNLHRSMPKSYEFLEQNFVNLKGYNKIGDNTFPNLMAILTGQNLEQLKKSCPKNVVLNKCDFIWNHFKDSGYTTGYAEDECNIATWNFNRPGFLELPTDHYYRPYFLAAEKLEVKKRHGMCYCAGPENSGERIYRAAKDFSVALRDAPSFGLFWTNSFSHDDVNEPSSMDEATLKFLNDTEFRTAIAKDTIFIFLSDHGFRFGDIRYTHTGWLEERLPFIYLYVPENFVLKFTQKKENLLTNSHRLTTPYDLHTTLLDVLTMGNKTFVSAGSLGCENCRSIFDEIPETRDCKAVNIDQHYCTCTGHNYMDPKDKMSVEISKFVVRSVNKLVLTFDEGSNCVEYSFVYVVSAGVSENYLGENNETVRYFLVILKTDPEAMFEATVEKRVNSNTLKILGDISRVNRYGEDSDCVKNGDLKKYCYCDTLFGKLKTSIKRLTHVLF